MNHTAMAEGIPVLKRAHRLAIIGATIVGVAFAISWSERARHVQAVHVSMER